MKIPATGVGTVKVMLVTGEGVPEMSVANSQESLIKNVLTQRKLICWHRGMIFTLR